MINQSSQPPVWLHAKRCASPQPCMERGMYVSGAGLHTVSSFREIIIVSGIFHDYTHTDIGVQAKGLMVCKRFGGQEFVHRHYASTAFSAPFV